MKFGLYLSGGGARGFAHIGVLKVLDEINFKPSAIAGCSMGSVIGALYAAGLNGNEIEKEILRINSIDYLKFFGINFSKIGLIERKGAISFFKEILPIKDFNDLKIPFAINTVNIDNGKQVILNKGDIIEAVSASTSVPGVFPPVETKHGRLVDGGVVNNLALGILDDFDLDLHVLVNVIHDPISPKHRTFDIVKQSIYIMMHEISQYKKTSFKGKLVEICPKVENYEVFDLHKASEIIKQGELAARKQIKKTDSFKNLYLTK